VRRRWVIVAIGLSVALVFTIAGSYYLVRRAVIKSLAASCHEALQAKDWQRLEQSAERWRGWEPGKAAPLVYLAEAARKTGRNERAAELLGQSPDSDKLTPSALLDRSTILFGPLNRPIEGAEALERAVKLDPKLAEARRRLIFFYAFTLQRPKMVRHCYEAIRHDCDLPETYVYLMLQDSLSFANAYDVNTKWFQGDPDEELFLVARAVYRVTSRDLDGTPDPMDGPPAEDGTPYQQKVMAEYFSRFPQNVELLAYYLRLSCTAGDVEEVAGLLARAPPEATSDNRFWRYKGWLHMNRDELPEARQAFDNALALNCYDSVTRHLLAGVERRSKRLDRVRALEELATEGKKLRRDLYELESVTKVPPGALKRMALHARKCGDDLAAGKLLLRVEQWSEEWSRLRAEPVASL
jgi:tetratricopeptide (TPR) repeat protein